MRGNNGSYAREPSLAPKAVVLSVKYTMVALERLGREYVPS